MKQLINFRAITFFAGLFAISFLGQSFTTRPPTPSVQTTFGSEVIVPQGTPVMMRLFQNINSDQVEVGNVVDFEVADGVIVDGKEVIAQGTIAEGEIISLERLDGCSDCQGKFQKIEIKVDKVKAVDGKMIRLYGKPMLVKAKCATCPVQLNQGLRLSASVQATTRVRVQ
jgi:hypothetical protein